MEQAFDYRDQKVPKKSVGLVLNSFLDFTFCMTSCKALIGFVRIPKIGATLGL